MLELAPIATIDRIGTSTWVDDRHRSPTAAATQKATEQRLSAAPRLHASRLAKRVGGDLLLIALELRPIDVALVVILQQNLPLLHRFAAAIALSHMPVHNLRLHLALAVAIGTCVEPILQKRENVAIPHRCPVERDHRPAVRRAWTAHLLLRQRQEDLPCATQFTKPREDLPDGFLNTQVGIEAKSGLPVLHVADRDGNAQLAARATHRVRTR